MRSRPSLLALAALLPALAGCPPGGAQRGDGNPVDCGGEARPALDCRSEVAYDGLKTEGGASVLNLGSVQGATEKVAIRRINEQVEQYVAAQTRLCRDYNACIVSAAEYKARAAELSNRLLGVGTAVEAMNAAPSYRDRQQALAGIYDAVVPAAERPEDLTLRMTVEAELPATVGGGLVRLAPGGRLPTNAMVAFTFEASRTAYVYVFQRSPSGEPTVLFPDPRIGARNPLVAGTPQRIPSGGGRFRVNEQDVGPEQIYIVASVEPLATLDEVMGKVVAGAVKNVADSPELAALSAVPATDTAGCAPPGQLRGLELAPGPVGCSRGLELAPSGAPTSLAARTDPGDSLILKAFPFLHVREAEFSPANAAAPTAEPPPTRRRGGAAEEEEGVQR